MKPLEIKGARTRLGYKQQFMADQLGLNIHSYRKKESGELEFTNEQKFAISKLLQLSEDQMNNYLFDGRLGVDDDGYYFLRIGFHSDNNS